MTDDRVVPLAERLWARGDNAWDRGHLDEAERLFRSAAEMGDPSAMDSLATLLDETRRPDEAVVWYERALAAGNQTTAWNLAMHYVPLRNMDLYRHWMQKAAEFGEKDAIAEVKKFGDPQYMTELPF